MNPSIISLILNSTLAAMQVKHHFDLKKLNAGVSQLLGELPQSETRADDSDFGTLLGKLRHRVGPREQTAILSLMNELSAGERNAFRALLSARVDMTGAPSLGKAYAGMRDAIDKERLDFLTELAHMQQDEALTLLRTGVGITPKPGATDVAGKYIKILGNFIAAETPRIIDWTKRAALKTHALVFTKTPRKQSIISVLLGKLLIGGTAGSISNSTEVEMLNNIFETFKKGDSK